MISVYAFTFFFKFENHILYMRLCFWEELSICRKQNQGAYLNHYRMFITEYPLHVMLDSRRNDLFILCTHSKFTCFLLEFPFFVKASTYFKCLVSQFIRCQANNDAIDGLKSESALEDIFSSSLCLR